MTNLFSVVSFFSFSDMKATENLKYYVNYDILKAVGKQHKTCH